MKNKKKLKEIIDLLKVEIEFDRYNVDKYDYLYPLFIDNAILNALQPMVYDAGILVDEFSETAPAQYSLWIANAELAYNLITVKKAGILWKFSDEQKEELNNILTEWIETLKAKLGSLENESALNK